MISPSLARTCHGNPEGWHRSFIRVLLALLLFCPPHPLPAQDWNSPTSLDLIRRAREVRHSVARDPEFRSYSAQARGYVHFFIDREDTGERILVKTDQIALEVYWAAPNRFKQRIVGLRDEKSLPTNIHYHLDHLVVVQDEFGDVIRIGDGDEVSSVIHPAAPAGELFYDYLLSDSITVTLQDTGESVRVYEVLVRPKDFQQPGFVGSVFLDQETAAIVRMSFTFTPASYVDPYLDHIQISLENGLWLGKYWLPYEQHLEIRREVPYLDIPAGSVIKGWFEIRDYEINPSLPVALFQGPTISALPEDQRRAFPFERGLHDLLDTEGLTPPPEMDEIRSMAVSLARNRVLSGLGGLRLHLPQPVVSSVFRFNREEGLFLGGGFSYGVSPGLGTALHGGFSLGRERPQLELSLTGGERNPEGRLSAFWNRPVDLGPRRGISGVLNTLSALILDEDYRDLVFTTGVSVSHTWSPAPETELTLEGRWEEHRKARDVVSSDPLKPRFRVPIPTDRGGWRSGAVDLTFPTPLPSVSAQLGALLGGFEGRTFGELEGGLHLQRNSLAQGTDFSMTLDGGLILGRPPRQGYYFLGGRETVPGYDYRSQVGDGFWLLRGQVTRDIRSPWARLRAFAAAGGTVLGNDAPVFPNRSRTDSPLLTSLGLGVGLGWDVIRMDMARGLGEGGDWALILSINHAFWAWL